MAQRALSISLRRTNETRINVIPQPKSRLLNIPAEIRDHIYVMLAEATILYVRSRRHEENDKVPWMLLVSKQVAAEYRGILLQKARIHACVGVYGRYDFGRLIEFHEELPLTDILHLRDRQLQIHRNKMIVQLDLFQIGLLDDENEESEYELWSSDDDAGCDHQDAVETSDQDHTDDQATAEITSEHDTARGRRTGPQRNPRDRISKSEPVQNGPSQDPDDPIQYEGPLKHDQDQHLRAWSDCISAIDVPWTYRARVSTKSEDSWPEIRQEIENEVTHLHIVHERNAHDPRLQNLIGKLCMALDAA